MEKSAVQEQFGQGHDCSQVVAAQFAAALELPAELLDRAMAGFGGGMQSGDTCGCVTGAYLVLGLKYGQDKAALLARMAEFRTAFTAQYGSTICREILKQDLSIPAEREAVMAQGLLFDLCPEIVQETIRLLEQAGL